jgi:hypothetical protein
VGHDADVADPLERVVSLTAHLVVFSLDMQTTEL